VKDTSGRGDSGRADVMRHPQLNGVSVALRRVPQTFSRLTALSLIGFVL
jgi:hypothetical protein